MNNNIYDLWFVKIGLMGLVEKEWLETLGSLQLEDVDYTDFVECARNLIPVLQNKVGKSNSNYIYCT